MHGIDQHKPLLNAALLDRRRYLTCDVEVGAPCLRLEPELFAIGFHGRRSVGAHSAELSTQDASRTISPISSINRLLPVYNGAMSVKKTTTSSRPPQSPRLRLSAHAKIVLRGRYLAKNNAGTIIETPAQLFWRVATDIAQAERLYPIAGRLPHAAQRWYDCMARFDFLPNSPTLMNAGRRIQQLSACFVLPVEDSLASVYDSLKHQALIHQSGGGTGFSFSHVRPHNDRVASSRR